MLPNLSARPHPGGGANRVGMSQGMGHLLQRINLPSVAVLSDYGHDVLEARATAWGVPWAVDVEEVIAASDAAAKLRADMEMRHFPDADPERIRGYDNVRRVDFGSGSVVVPGATISAEVVRAPVLEYGMSTLEKINTWVRAQPFVGDAPSGPPIELGAYFDDVADVSGSPFPFPLVHPGSFGGLLSIEWRLNFQNVPMISGRAPAMLPPGAGTQRIATGHPWLVWDDQRYAWGSVGSVRHQFIFGGHGILRMYAVLSVTLSETEDTNWVVSVAGRLGGYTQQAGIRGRARYDATRRN